MDEDEFVTLHKPFSSRSTHHRSGPHRLHARQHGHRHVACRDRTRRLKTTGAFFFVFRFDTDREWEEGFAGEAKGTPLVDRLVRLGRFSCSSPPVFVVVGSCWECSVCSPSHSATLCSTCCGGSNAVACEEVGDNEGVRRHPTGIRVEGSLPGGTRGTSNGRVSRRSFPKEVAVVVVE